MHERTQRAIARLMFVFCCAVPTAITMVCVLVTWTPWYHHRSLKTIESRLLQHTGMVVEIDDYERADPATVHLLGVRILEPESGREVARVRRIQWVSRTDEVSILLQQPELQSKELPAAWRMIHDRFLCLPQHTKVPIKFAANDLTIHSRTGALTLRDVDAWIEPTESSVEATIECLPANSRTDSPVSMTVRRDRDGDVPATSWLLDTRGTPLPCSALAEYLPQLASLGSDAVFTGTIRWQLRADHQWLIDLGGSQFDQVSLDRLFERQGHRLSGTASIQLRRCRIDPSQRRSDIAGSIRAREGTIGRSLLISANQHLGFQVRIPEEVLDARRDVPYDRIALGFQVNNTQLQLEGICRTEVGYESFPPGVVLCLDLQPLVQSSGATLDSLRVISAIAPTHSVPVPLSSQTSALINVFIPPSRPLPRDDQYGPPRIRSVENFRNGPTIPQPMHR